jgi:hypothetical protein
VHPTPAIARRSGEAGGFVFFVVRTISVVFNLSLPDNRVLAMWQVDIVMEKMIKIQIKK